MNLAHMLQSSTTYAGTPHVQPATASVGVVDYTIKHVATEAHYHNTTDSILTTSPVGWTIPNPVILNGLPPVPQITGTPDIRTTDAPVVKGCN